MFTRETRVATMVGQPEYAGHELLAGAFPGALGAITGPMKLKTLERLSGAWDADTLARGMEYVLEQARARRIFYDIYSDAERKADPSKANTGIAAYPLERLSRFVIVCAGGAYSAVSTIAEANPVIQRLNEMGYAAFALLYRCGKDAKAPNPMDDLAQAVQFILNHADELGVLREDYAVMGFSAGGHLAASFGTESLGFRHYGLPAPSTLVLSYPVITMGEKTHVTSRNNLLGKKPSMGQVEAYSVERQVDAAYPPSFVWQFDHDYMVPIDNSQMMVDALAAAGVRHEYVTYPGKVHGAGLGVGTPAEGWLEQAVAFWDAVVRDE